MEQIWRCTGVCTMGVVAIQRELDLCAKMNMHSFSPCVGFFFPSQCIVFCLRIVYNILWTISWWNSSPQASSPTLLHTLPIPWHPSGHPPSFPTFYQQCLIGTTLSPESLWLCHSTQGPCPLPANCQSLKGKERVCLIQPGLVPNWS